MLVAAAGAATLGAWAEGALLLFLFSIGHALEHYAMGRAKRAIEALAEARATHSAPFGEATSVAWKFRSRSSRSATRWSCVPNERLPADGFVVVKGTTSINQAPVTGESMPVDKRPVPDPGLARAPGRADRPPRRASSPAPSTARERSKWR
jgi:Cd2+/Zn2+-exporting ATPase